MLAAQPGAPWLLHNHLTQVYPDCSLQGLNLPDTLLDCTTVLQRSRVLQQVSWTVCELSATLTCIEGWNLGVTFKSAGLVLCITQCTRQSLVGYGRQRSVDCERGAVVRVPERRGLRHQFDARLEVEANSHHCIISLLSFPEAQSTRSSRCISVRVFPVLAADAMVVSIGFSDTWCKAALLGYTPLRRPYSLDYVHLEAADRLYLRWSIYHDVLCSEHLAERWVRQTVRTRTSGSMGCWGKEHCLTPLVR